MDSPHIANGTQEEQPPTPTPPPPPPPSPSQSLSPPPSPSPLPQASPTDLEEQIAAAIVAQQNMQWQGAILTFCFTFAIEMALQFEKTHSQLSLSLKLVSFANLLTFSLLFVANFINGRFARMSQLLEKVAIVLAALTLIYSNTSVVPNFH